MVRFPDRCRRAVTAAILVALASGCEPSGPSQPNVLLIVVDTLRYDHLGCYGYERDTSPQIDALAADSILVERAYATAPWTLPSIASMFTGLYPNSHATTKLNSKLPDDVTTLAEILKQQGYVTGGVISHVLLTVDRNFNQGFDQYHPAMRGNTHDTASTNVVTQRAQNYLRQFAGQDQPFFIFAHYFDPHYNYLRHAEFGFSAPSVGRLKPGQDVEGLYDMAADLTPEEVQFLRDLYDEEIRYTDRGIGRLVATLKELHLYDQTLILLVGDHGEEFVDHGNLGHARSLYDEVVRVPLILRNPHDRDGPRRVEGPVSLVSLTPTILDLLGVDSGKVGFQARSFAPVLASEESPQSHVVYCEVDFGYYEVYRKALLMNGRKIIRDDTTGKIEIYDLNEDPFEKQDLATSSPDAITTLLPVLESHIKLARGEAFDAEQTTLSAEQLEQLRSLGYLGQD